MKFGTTLEVLLLFCFLLSTCEAVSLDCESGGSGGTVSLSVNYALDGSTGMNEEIVLGDGQILQHRTLEGDGSNALYQQIKCAKGTISSDISSSGALRSATSSYASGDLADSTQNVGVIGESEIMISGSSGSLSASQKAGVLSGATRSSQKISVQEGSVRSAQASEIAGALGYADGNARSSEDAVRITGGLNGLGAINGQITTSASDGASGSGVFRADSLTSKAYSAAKATSADGDAYSYLSSDKQLASSISTRADELVSTEHDLMADGDVLVFASTPDESESYTAETVSGSISAGSPQNIENKLQGDLQSATSDLIPTPGSWVWNNYGSYLTSDPFIIEDDQGRDHVFVRGGSGALYDNVWGDWYGFGGYIYSNSDPYAVKDGQGRIHIFARDSDGSLLDNVFDTYNWNYDWWDLGGYFTLDPSAALEPGPNGFLKIVVRGGDNALWMRDLDTRYMSGVWNPLGGYLTSGPYVIYDDDGRIHTFVRGGDGSLWDNVGVWDAYSGQYWHDWNYHGGYITSHPKPIVDPNYNSILVFARGGDGALWAKDFSPEGFWNYWTSHGGYISPAGSGSIIYEGNPEPVADSDGYIHTFVRGGDGSLWDNVWYHTGNPAHDWYGLGGYITSDPSAMWDASGHIDVAVRGGDGTLWVNTIY